MWRRTSSDFKLWLRGLKIRFFSSFLSLSLSFLSSCGLEFGRHRLTKDSRQRNSFPNLSICSLKAPRSLRHDFGRRGFSFLFFFAHAYFQLVFTMFTEPAWPLRNKDKNEKCPLIFPQGPFLVDFILRGGTQSSSTFPASKFPSHVRKHSG